jgi:phage pi2 protein 07
MTDGINLFRVLRDISRQQQQAVLDMCPGMESVAGSQENISDRMMEHIAFCPACRKHLQILNTGSVYTALEHEPDWERLLKRIKMSAHWERIKERMQRLSRELTAIFPDIQMVAMRQNDAVTEEKTIIIFEINLTELPGLSPGNLSITRLEHKPENECCIIEITGFYPELAGAGARLGISRRSSIVDACGKQVSSPHDLRRIETRLQEGFEQQNGPPETFDRLIEDTVWLDGNLERYRDGARLVLRCSEQVSSLFFRSDVWSMLLVFKA